jgi:hypothetical protein
VPIGSDWFRQLVAQQGLALSPGSCACRLLELVAVVIVEE